MVRLLSAKDVASLVTMPDALRVVEEAFKQIVLGTAKVPQRIAITDPAPGLTLIMPGIMGGGMNALATKIVSVYKDNPLKHNKPTVLAKIMVQDMETGEIIGIMDGGLITAMRTGAATGVSVKYLARKNSSTMGIFGAGVQAKKQVHAVYWALAKKLDLCKVYDTKKSAAEAFKVELEKELGIKVEIVEKSDDLLQNVDIIVAATTSPNPLFDGAKVSEGIHISSIGAHAPAARELDSTLIRRAAIRSADMKSACLAEAGDYILPINEHIITPDDIISIGEIILGKKPGRINDSQITIFKSVGISAQDVSVAKLVYDEAVKKGIGQDFQF